MIYLKLSRKLYSHKTDLCKLGRISIYLQIGTIFGTKGEKTIRFSLNFPYAVKPRFTAPRFIANTDLPRIFPFPKTRGKSGFYCSYMVIRRIICARLGEFLFAKLELQTRKYPQVGTIFCTKAYISIRDMTDRFSLNFPDIDIFNLAQRNSPKIAQIIYLIAI